MHKLAGHGKEKSRIQLALPFDTAKATDENYTPAYFLEPCRSFLGGFDLDPFSCEKANQTVRAATHWNKSDDAFLQDWSPFERKWVNPPYSRSIIARAVEKTINYSHIGETLLLVNSSTSARWFHLAMQHCAAYLHPFKRIQFQTPNGRSGKSSNEYDQTLFYFGNRPIEFAKALSGIGDAVQPLRSTFTLKILSSMRQKDVLGGNQFEPEPPLEQSIHDRLAVLENRRDQIINSGPIAPPAIWIEYGKVSKRKFRQAYYRSEKAVFQAKNKSGLTKQSYIGAENSDAVVEAAEAIGRRNELESINKEIRSLKERLDL